MEFFYLALLFMSFILWLDHNKNQLKHSLKIEQLL